MTRGVILKKDKGLEKEVLDFLKLNIPDVDDCGGCAICCTRFGYDGPQVGDSEIDVIKNALRYLNFDKEADYLEEHGSIPAIGEEPLERVCIAYDTENKGCMLHDLVKPRICQQTPNIIYRNGNSIILESHFYNGSCRKGMVESDLRMQVELLAEEFELTFGMPLVLKAGYPIEGRAHRFFDDER